MFEAVRNNKRIVQVILGVITLSFALFGVESYLRNGSQNDEVAEVGGSPISKTEWDRALRDQQERIRSANGGQVDEGIFRSKEFRQAVLENLINQRALAQQVFKAKLVVSDRQLQTAIVSIPSFQTAGQFDAKLYQSVLESQGMSRPGFEAQLRQDLAVNQVVSSVAESALAPVKDAEWLLQAQLEQRDIRIREFSSAHYLAKVSIDEDAIRGFYEKNPGLFERPARLRAEYLVLDDRQIEKSIKISDEEARRWYEAHSEKFSIPEERRASHILITVPASAQEGDVAKAKATAEELMIKLRGEPSSFGVLAAKFSQDPGSAQKEGDLGFFGRGIMVKSFEDAIFQIKNIGELVGPVRSDYGFHIIKLTGLKPGKVRPFEEVAFEIRDELKKQTLGKRFAEAAESFSNVVYEQADSLGPVAERFQLKTQQTDWIQKDSDTLGAYKSKKLVDALFSDDSIQHHRNTEAVDVGGGALVSARVIAHEPAHRLSLEEAKGQITDLLKQQEASKLAVADGEKAMATLKAGQPIPEGWSSAQSLQRRPGLPPALVRAAFGIPGDKLPGYAGFSAPNGSYVVVMLEKVTSEPIKADDSRLKAVKAQYQQLLGRSELSGYLAQVKDRLGVKVESTALKEGSE